MNKGNETQDGHLGSMKPFQKVSQDAQKLPFDQTWKENFGLACYCS